MNFLKSYFQNSTIQTRINTHVNLSYFVNLTQQRFRHRYIERTRRVRRDFLRHESVKEMEIPRMVLKAIHRDTRLDTKTRLKASMTLSSTSNYGSRTSLKPRCVETGRGNGLVKGWRISRIVFREAAINGRIPGMLGYHLKMK